MDTKKKVLITILLIVIPAALLLLYSQYKPEPIPGAIYDVTDANFVKEVLDQKFPVYIVFHAKWCGFCKDQAPIVEALAPLYAGKVKFVRVDIDKAPVVIHTLGIGGIPSHVIVLPGKDDAMGKSGLLSKVDLIEFIETALLKYTAPNFSVNPIK